MSEAKGRRGPWLTGLLLLLGVAVLYHATLSESAVECEACGPIE